MKIFGWLADHSGCGWYRVALPLDQLRMQGLAETTFDSDFKNEESWDSDVVVCQRTCLPGPTEIIRRISLHKGKRPLLVFELDDNLWQIDPGNPLSKGFYKHPEVRENLVNNIKRCDLVTVSTEPLGEFVRQWNTNVVVLPNTIPADLLSWRHGRDLDKITLGWQGSPTHDSDWKPVAPVVERWFMGARKNGIRVEMHTIGSMPKSYPQVYPHRMTGWHDSIKAYYRVIDWDIALAPLQASAFNESKSDIRVLEAAALGIPIVASDVTAYRTVQHGVTGFLAKKPADWSKYLRVLVEDQDLRDAMEDDARRYAATRTATANAHLWLEAYTR